MNKTLTNYSTVISDYNTISGVSLMRKYLDTFTHIFIFPLQVIEILENPIPTTIATATL